MIHQTQTTAGMRLIVESQAQFGLSAVMLWSNVGGLTVPPHLSVCAAVLMQEFLESEQPWIAPLGGYARAGLHEDYFCLTLLVPPSYLNDALMRLREFVVKLQINEARILQWLTTHDHVSVARERTALQLAKHICARHFNRGYADITETAPATMDDYRWYRQHAFAAAQLTLTWVGDQPAAGVMQAMQKLWNDYAVENIMAPPLAQLPPHEMVCQAQHPLVGVGYLLPAMSLTAAIPYKVFAQMLMLRNQRLLEPYFYNGRYFAYWLLLSRNVEAATTFPYPEMAREAKQAVAPVAFDSALLEHAKQLVERDFLEAGEGVAGRAQQLYSFSNFDQINQLTDYLGQLQACDQAQIAQIQQQLTHQAATWVTAAPTLPLAEQLLPDFVQAYATATPDDPHYWQIPQFSESLTAQPSSTHSGEPQWQEYHQLLPHGYKVIALHSPKYQMDYFGFFLRGGRIYESEKNCGITHLLFSSLLSSFTHRLNQRQGVARTYSLNRQIEWQGGYLEADVTADLSGLRGYVLPRNLPGVLDEVSKSLFYPCLPEGAVLQWVKHNLGLRTRMRQNDLFHRTIDLFYKTVFGAHPYGLPRYGHDNSIAALSAKDLYAWHESWVHPSKAILVLLTQRSENDLKHILESWRATMPPPHKQPQNAEVLSFNQYTGSAHVVEIENQEAGVRSLVIGFPIPQAHFKQQPAALDVLQHALTGNGGVLIPPGSDFPITRAQAFYVPLNKGGVFFIYSEFFGIGSQRAKSLIYERLQNLIQHGLSASELLRAKNLTVGGHHLAYEAPLHELYELAKSYLIQAELICMPDYQRAVHAVSLETTHKIAKEILNPDRFASMLVRSAHELA